MSTRSGASRGDVSRYPVETSRSPATSLHPLESVALVTVWASRLAIEAGVRALIIKGPLMTSQGLRPEFASGDADVWVDPARFEEFVSSLEALGWWKVHSDARHTILPQHSATMRHDVWACELDVHDRIPGFFAEPGEVFELFWERRTTAELAHAVVLTPDRVGNTAILAVNQVRGVRPGQAADALASLAGVARTFDAGESAALATLVAAAGANETLAPFLGLAGIPSSPGFEASREELEGWRVLLSTQHAPATEWMVALKRARPWRWPGLAWRAFWLNEREVRLVEPGYAPGRWGLLRARLHRLRRGVTGLPRAMRVVLFGRDH